MIVTGGSVFQEEAGAGGDLPGVGERPGDSRHVELGEVGHQGDWLEAGPAGDQWTLTQISDHGCGLYICITDSVCRQKAATNEDMQTTFGYSNIESEPTFQQITENKVTCCHYQRVIKRNDLLYFSIKRRFYFLNCRLSSCL